MSRKRGRVELAQQVEFAERIVRALGRRVGAEGDEAELAALVALRARVDEAIEAGVEGIYSRGYDISWARIGAALGITRQAAWQRWGRARSRSADPTAVAS